MFSAISSTRSALMPRSHLCPHFFDGPEDGLRLRSHAVQVDGQQATEQAAIGLGIPTGDPDQIVEQAVAVLAVGADNLAGHEHHSRKVRLTLFGVPGGLSPSCPV